MENGIAKSFDRQLISQESDDESVDRRLEFLLKANTESARVRSLYPIFADELTAKTMGRPLDNEKVFSYFGLMLGSLPPASFFFLLCFKNGAHISPPLVIFLMSLTIIAASIVGFHTGKVCGVISRKIEVRSFTQRMFFFALLGLAWGIVAGAAGGAFLFVIGALFGAGIGGAVGAVALPLFTIPYLAVKHGGMIELKHFLPISLGVTMAICAYILGFLYR